MIDDGRITEVGTYTELMDNNGAFAELIRHYSTMEENEEGDSGKGRERGREGGKKEKKRDPHLCLVAADDREESHEKKPVSPDDSKISISKDESQVKQHRPSEIMTQETVKSGAVSEYNIIILLCTSIMYSMYGSCHV